MAKSNSQDPTLSAEPTYQKSGERQQSSLSYLANTVSKFEERRGDLVDRQHHLRDKITTMERSVPALMAFNMWLAAEKCEDAPLCKVKEIMNKFSPHPDPTEKLLENLANAVKNFTGETAELHDKIIATDIKLEESDMELESLELANKELEERVTELQEEVKKYTFPSLHSIHSEDLGCLTRIRQLGEAEAKLRNQVKDLEEKERLYNEQMTQILTSKEFQKASGTKKMTSRIQELELNSKKMHYALRNHKYNMHQMKKKLMQKDKELARLDLSFRIPELVGNGRRRQDLDSLMINEIVGQKACIESERVPQLQNEGNKRTNTCVAAKLETRPCPGVIANQCPEKVESKGRSSRVVEWLNDTQIKNSSKEPKLDNLNNALEGSIASQKDSPRRDLNLKNFPGGKIQNHFKHFSQRPPCQSLCPPATCCISISPGSQNSPRRKPCQCATASSTHHPCKKRSTDLPQDSLRKKSTCTNKPFCERPPCVTHASAFCPPIRKSTVGHESQSRSSHLPKCGSESKPRKQKILPSRKEYHEPRDRHETLERCRCSCKGRCALGESEVPCNCASNDYQTTMGYRPEAIDQPSLLQDLIISDEEYCEYECDDVANEF